MSVSLLRGRTVRRTLGALVVAGLLGAGVTGCSNDAGAKTENTIDASPTPTNTPTDGDGDSDGAEEPAQDTPAEPEQRPTPVEPEAMKTSDKAGAIAAAKFFVEVIEYSMDTTTVELLEKYSFEHCARCNNFIEVTNRRNKDGKIPASVRINAKENGEPVFVGEGTVIWRVPMRLKIAETWRAGEESKSETVNAIFSVGIINERWTLIEIGTVSS